MTTQCNPKELQFQPLGKRKITGKFTAIDISSDGGLTLLRETDKRFDVISRLARCFTDSRNPSRVKHSVESMLRQRIYGICCGYEDVNDHEELCTDSIMKLCCDSQDALAGKSTLNRLELGPDTDPEGRYKKIEPQFCSIKSLLAQVWMDTYPAPPPQVVIDVDVTDDPLHGNQEGRFYHGYYRKHCYLPLYVFCDDMPLCATLATAGRHPSRGVVEEIRPLVEKIRARWPATRIILRGDGGFSTEEIMSWCEETGVDYVLGMRSNSRLRKRIEKQMRKAWVRSLETSKAARVFKDFGYRTRRSWSRRRRIVAKAEYLPGGPNPRFVVTSLSHEDYSAGELYEELYCARGEMENWIKAQQLQLFADRTSTHYLRSNQLRLYMSVFAHILMELLRRFGLKGTDLGCAQYDTIRLKLFKIGVLVKTSVRRVLLLLSETYPYADLFRQVLEKLRTLPLRC